MKDSLIQMALERAPNQCITDNIDLENQRAGKKNVNVILSRKITLISQPVTILMLGSIMKNIILQHVGRQRNRLIGKFQQLLQRQTD